MACSVAAKIGASAALPPSTAAQRTDPVRCRQAMRRGLAAEHFARNDQPRMIRSSIGMDVIPVTRRSA
jgi:hypothetical protein